MPPGSTDVLTDVKIALARIEERQLASAEAADHRHRNLMMRVENFVPRQEIEKDQKARDERIGALEDRVKTIEHRAWGGMAAIAGTFLTAVWQAFKH